MLNNYINFVEADSVQPLQENLCLVTLDGTRYLTDAKGIILEVLDELFYQINYAPREEVKEDISFEGILNQMLETYKAKNNDYGNSVQDTYDKFGDISFLTRINDKINRLNTLCTTSNQMVKDESINDTILDLANYAVLFYLIRNR